jgi:hypothetical protein
LGGCIPGPNWNFTILDGLSTVANSVSWPNYQWMPGIHHHVASEMVHICQDGEESTDMCSIIDESKMAVTRMMKRYKHMTTLKGSPTRYCIFCIEVLFKVCLVSFKSLKHFVLLRKQLYICLALKKAAGVHNPKSY